VLISPKRPNNFGTALMRNEDGDNETIRYEDIKPLMLEKKIIVKSKKKKNLMKKSNQSNCDEQQS